MAVCVQSSCWCWCWSSTSTPGSTSSTRPTSSPRSTSWTTLRWIHRQRVLQQRPDEHQGPIRLHGASLLQERGRRLAALRRRTTPAANHPRALSCPLNACSRLSTGSCPTWHQSVRKLRHLVTCQSSHIDREFLTCGLKMHLLGFFKNRYRIRYSQNTKVG